MPLTFELRGKLITIGDSERQECEIYDRVVGYYRPISEFNIGQKQYHKERHFHQEKEILKKLIDNPLQPL